MNHPRDHIAHANDPKPTLGERPSAGALRAAKEIEFRAHDIARKVSVDPASFNGLSDEQLRFVARLIDRETGMRELVEAVKRLASVCELGDIRPHVQGHLALVYDALTEIEGEGESDADSE